MKKLNLKNFKGGPGNIFIVAIVVLGVLLLLTRITEFVRPIASLSYSTFKNQVQQNQVSSVHISGTEVSGYKDGRKRFETVVGDPSKLEDFLEKHGVEISYASPSTDFSFWHILLLLGFIMTPLALWYFFRQARGTGGGGGTIFSMSKSKAKMFMPAQVKVKFDSVAGAYEAKEELQDVVDFLKNPEKYRRLGAKLTRGVLLVGEPGNGKTLLAKAVAGEANCPFFSTSGSDFIEVFVGVGPARVRDLFAQARKHAPSIVFIDEIDAVGRQRGAGLGGGHDEREQTLNQLLTEMDGFDTAQSSVIVLGATNRPDVLDKALLRPGRFDRRVDVPFPDLKSREEILKVHAKGVKIDAQVELNKIARGTPGFTGADLANLINEAAINASKNNQEIVELADFEEARDKILLGKERKSIMLSEDERKVTAYHEAGHALVTLLIPDYSDPLYKVTIIPRGRALGVTHSLPEREKHSVSKDEMESQVIMALGGRAAEEIVFNRLETGAASDFKKATEIVRRMICYYGMSKNLGLVVYEQHPGEYQYSEETARQIDNEIRNFMEKYYQKALQLLRDNRDKLDRLANALLEKETLFPYEIYELLGIEPREEHSFS